MSTNWKVLASVEQPQAAVNGPWRRSSVERSGALKRRVTASTGWARQVRHLELWQSFRQWLIGSSAARRLVNDTVDVGHDKITSRAGSSWLGCRPDRTWPHEGCSFCFSTTRSALINIAGMTETGSYLIIGSAVLDGSSFRVGRGASWIAPES
jgi:hypothetical protein